MIALNVETTSDEFENKEIRRSGKSFSRDYEMLTIEICFIGKVTVIFFSIKISIMSFVLYFLLLKVF